LRGDVAGVDREPKSWRRSRWRRPRRCGIPARCSHRRKAGRTLPASAGSHTIFNSGDHAGHKLENITHILETFTHLPFVLIGDSGEKDPEIYRQIIENFPNRIRAVYIRDVNPNPERRESVNKLITEIGEIGSQLVFAPDSEFAAHHAAENGLIAPEELENIHIEKKIDENAPTAAEIIQDEII
jgi:hypothetical protein